MLFRSVGTRIVAGKLRAVAGIRISDFDSATYLQKHAVPRAKQYIDDFKRDIYMEVQRRINTRENNYICLALEEEADKRAYVLDCNGCVDCTNCIACTNCTNCKECTNCIACSELS